MYKGETLAWLSYNHNNRYDIRFAGIDGFEAIFLFDNEEEVLVGDDLLLRLREFKRHFLSKTKLEHLFIDADN